MQLPFYKYEGTGNDFIMINHHIQDAPCQYAPKLVQKLCNRRFSIGANGIILLKKHPQHDFEMVHYNADGSQGGLCANGSRCAVHLAQYLGIIQNKANFLAIDGVHYAYIMDNLVHLTMNNTPTIIKVNNDYIINNGNKHYVRFDKNTIHLDIVKANAALIYHPHFHKEGGNVNFLAIMKDHIFVRSYERGVTEETLSCGTGVVAAALAIALDKGWASPITVQTKGGTLWVRFELSHDRGFQKIDLIAPVKRIFQGSIDLSTL